MGWTLFYNPMNLTFHGLLYLLVPLCLSVAVVYKTIRVKHLRRLPVAIAGLIGYMLVGLLALGAGLWAIQRYWP